MSSNKIRCRLTEFFATLDMAAEFAQTMTRNGMSPFLNQVFGSQDEFDRVASQFSELKGRFADKDELVRLVARFLEENPAKFLVLTHLHRQKRFTNVELVNFLFDSKRLGDLSYYEDLLKTDSGFKATFEKVWQQTSWQGYIDTTDADLSKLASFKKTVSRYLGDERSCWKLWSLRIQNDPTARDRIASFVVRNEDLDRLIEQDAVQTALQRSLRTVNVESVKRERGGYGARRVREALERFGFMEHDYGTHDIIELNKVLKEGRGGSIPDLGYAREVEWKNEAKRFDFVLIAGKQLGFVMEVNYFSTSMSKIREVLKDFKELKKTCTKHHYPFIYVTDGVGWLKLVNDVERMLEFEAQEAESDEMPFLVNLTQLENNLPRMKSQMKRSA